MSDISFNGFEEYKTAEYDDSKKDTKTLFIKIILVVLCLLLLSEAVIYLFVVPCLNPVKVTWRGLDGYTEAEMNRALSPMSGRNWIHFNKNDACTLLSTVSGVENVDIVKRFPDRVILTVNPSRLDPIWDVAPSYTKIDVSGIDSLDVKF